MKKFILFISSIFLFGLLFFFSDLDSFADQINYSFPTSSVSYSGTFGNDHYFVTIRSLAQHGCVVRESDNDYYYCTESYIMDSDESATPFNFIQINSNGVPSGTSYGRAFIFTKPPATDILGNDCLVFNSYSSARNYLIYGDEEGIIENGDILENIINWGNNDPSNSTYNPDTDNIPEPQFVIDTSNGNNHSIRFTNQIYNYSDHGVYGLVMKASWVSFDDFTLTKTGANGFDNKYKVYYQTTLENGATFDMYTVPQFKSDIVRTPSTINFNTNELSVNGFNDFLNLYPVLDRTVNMDPVDNGSSLLFRDFLTQPSCPYNSVVFSCYYYREMSDGTFRYGPIATSHFDVPVQGAIYDKDLNNIDSSSAGSIPGFDPGTSPGGTISPGGYPSGDYADAQNLYQNMTGLFSFIGDLPQFVKALFSFLPEWLIVFIAVSIGLVVAIGVVKLFVG